jgi:hypothetical protein
MMTDDAPDGAGPRGPIDITHAWVGVCECGGVAVMAADTPHDPARVKHNQRAIERSGFRLERREIALGPVSLTCTCMWVRGKRIPAESRALTPEEAANIAAMSTGRTHWDRCWQDLSHSDCARARVACLEAELDQTRAARDEALRQRDAARHALDFAEGAIRDAVGLEDGLDGGDAATVLSIIQRGRDGTLALDDNEKHTAPPHGAQGGEDEA